MSRISVVIPNLNGEAELKTCLDSLIAQTTPCSIIVVENGSSDNSREFVETHYPNVELIVHKTNLGFAGGVNAGIRRSMQLGDDYVALFNNDAVATNDWLKNMSEVLDRNPRTGIVTCKLTDRDGTLLDSTGENYTHWGLSYPRGRGRNVDSSYDKDNEIFGASGGASLYRISTLREIGLFDEDFFAYYEDVDISFRAQLADWKVIYEPTALAFHQRGATSGKIPGFTTYQTMKNIPWIVIKDVPLSLLPGLSCRFSLAYSAFFFSAISTGRGKYAVHGVVSSLLKIPKKLIERHHIQSTRKVSPDYIWSIMTHDLPPNAANLRRLRAGWWKITGRKTS